MIPLIIIEGPTAAGKSFLAIQIAEALETEIISADSRQIYRYMNIGTAKPTKQERERIKHHLIDIVEPNEEYSAGQFSSDADTILKQLNSEGKIPIICGGTGFYIKSLLEGLFAAPEIPEKIRTDLEELEDSKGTDYLFQMLLNVDPNSADRIHQNDSYRIKRALEVWIATGKSLGEHWENQEKIEKKYNTCRIMVTEDRQILYERINSRLEKMIQDGLINEIKQILEAGYSEDDPGITSVGYREFIPFIKENTSFLTCLEEAKKDTRNYAKRQLTWYRKVFFDMIIHITDYKVHDLLDRIKYFLESEDKALS
ncbi:MAG: tRNA (adenosine(37)-N6)-dimethylallyltransferase MiaA [Candidatus Cloacimonetes bacterium]|nr:tRNA (adenosine(37)-N6)-dimethylallyltransferase MiaA [Candidatus Cloacimonadota bacterium]